jgi:hypothetical protein
MFTDLNKNKFESLKRECCSRNLPERIRINMLRELIMMLILIFEVINVTNLRKSFNLLLMMRSRKQKQRREAHKKFKRDGSDDSEEEEKFIILEHRPDPLTVINNPIQNNLTPFEIQPVVKHRRILRDDN